VQFVPLGVKSGVHPSCVVPSAGVDGGSGVRFADVCHVLSQKNWARYFAIIARQAISPKYDACNKS
jgi:hypothetical protein